MRNTTFVSVLLVCATAGAWPWAVVAVSHHSRAEFIDRCLAKGDPTTPLGVLIQECGDVYDDYHAVLATK
jgi:hypothetical protein